LKQSNFLQNFGHRFLATIKLSRLNLTNIVLGVRPHRLKDKLFALHRSFVVRSALEELESHLRVLADAPAGVDEATPVTVKISSRQRLSSTKINRMLFKYLFALAPWVM